MEARSGFALSSMTEQPPLRSLVDDPENILNSDTILRLIPPGFFVGREIQSNAFQDQSLSKAHEFGLAGPCASVNMRRIWEEHGGDIRALLEGFDAGLRARRSQRRRRPAAENSWPITFGSASGFHDG